MALREVGTRHKVKELELLSPQQQSQAVQVTAFCKTMMSEESEKSFQLLCR